MSSHPFRSLTAPLLLAAALLVPGCSAARPASPPVTAAPAAGGPRDVARLTFADTVTLGNGHVEVGVAPGVGRIVRFAPAGGENVLWVAPAGAYDHPFVAYGRTYVNVGGDKVWPTVQALWPRAYGGGDWPPEAAIDGSPWTLVEHSPGRIVIESPVSPALGVRVRRTIALPANAPRVEITNELTRVKPSVFPVHLWTVTQAVPPAAVMLDIAADRAAAPPFVHLSDPAAVAPHLATVADDEAVRWRLDQVGDAKLGTLGRWVAALYPDTIFLQSTGFDPRAAYPDASSVQVYSSGDYTELELLSPFVHLQPGQTLTNRVTWQLLPRPADASPESLHRLLDDAAGR